MNRALMLYLENNTGYEISRDVYRLRGDRTFEAGDPEQASQNLNRDE